MKKNKVEILTKLSEEMQQVLRFQQQNITAEHTGAELSYAQIRQQYETERQFWNEGGPVMASMQDIYVPHKNNEILTRIYRPENITSTACLFYLHGGGFVVGSINTHDRIMRLLAHNAGCIVIGIDYSLAPEAKFPQAMHECAAVSNYFRAHAEDYHFNAEYIGYAGDSAGAALALATCLWLREQQADTSYIKALLLYYGLYGLQDSRSQRLYGGSWDGLTQADLKYYQDMYLASAADSQSPYYCFFNHDLTYRMPACFIAACEFDPLIDDSETLYTLLQDKGIACEYKIYPGTLHAFLHYSRMMKVSGQAIADGAHYFNTCLM